MDLKTSTPLSDTYNSLRRIRRSGDPQQSLCGEAMEATKNAGSASEFEHLKITLDSRTLEPSRRVKNIEQDGSFTYEEERTTADELTETLTRIWNEIPDGMLDLTEERLETKPMDEPAAEMEDEESGSKESKDPSGLMQWDDMVKLREAVGMQLNNARNELWFSLELAKTLAVSSTFPANPPFVPIPVVPAPNKKGNKPKKADEPGSTPVAVPGADAPVFPPGTLSTTPFRRAAPSHAQVIHDMELALAAKQSALEECERMIDTAVEEFAKQTEASRRFWRDIRELKEGRDGRGQWAVVPKPDFGKILAAGESARDVVIPYAVDEASASMRSRSLAAFDLDPNTDTPLTFGSRSRRILRISCTDSIGATSTSSGLPSTSGTDNLVEIQNAQIEAFDEDLYNEVREDVSRRPGATVDADNARLVLGDLIIVFELTSSEGASPPGSGSTADLMLQSCRLSLLNILKQRKRRLTSANWSRPPSVLSPVLQICHFAELSRKAEAVFHTFAGTLTRVGVGATVVRRSDLMDSTGKTLLQGLLQGEQDYSSVGAVLTLDIAGCAGVSMTLSATTPATVTTSQSTFNLSDISDLAQLLAEELSFQLLRLVAHAIQDKLPPDSRRVVFLDELDCNVATPLGTIEVLLSSPYDTIHAEVVRKASETAQIEPFEGHAGASLFDWLTNITRLCHKESGE